MVSFVFNFTAAPLNLVHYIYSVLHKGTYIYKDYKYKYLLLI